MLLVAAVGGVILGSAFAPTAAERRGDVVRARRSRWYLAVAAFLPRPAPLGVLLRRSPLIVLLSLEIMLNGANLALIAFSRTLGDGRRPDLRPRGHGRRRLRGRASASA